MIARVGCAALVALACLSQRAAAQQGPPPALIHLRLEAVILSDNDGSNPPGVLTIPQLQEWISVANQVFAAAGNNFIVDFDPARDVDYVRDSCLNRLNHDQNAAASALAAKPLYTGKLVVLFRAYTPDYNTQGVADPACKKIGGINGNAYTAYNTYARGISNSFIVEPSVYCGMVVATDFADASPHVPHDHSGCRLGRPSGHNRILVQNYNTLIHNIGHYFGLAHTFPGASDFLSTPHALLSWYSGTPRILPRSIDVFDGDGPKGPELANSYGWTYTVTDTRPEAGTSLFLQNDMNTCNSAATAGKQITDESGAILVFIENRYLFAGVTQPPDSPTAVSLMFEPDRDNVMSYFLCKFPMRLSTSQISTMRTNALRDPNHRYLICDNPDNTPVLPFVDCP